MKYTESQSTKWLQRQIYCGAGEKYLGWDNGVYEILPDGSERCEQLPRPRYWTIPEDRIRWSPLIDHLKGNHRGLVAKSSTHLPFVTTELDRHHGENSTDHIRQAMATGKLLKAKFSQCRGIRLNWCAEVNRHNGSVKFFGWGHRPIPLAIAKDIGQRILDALTEHNLLDDKGTREVFPLNCPAVMLPLRQDKTTIIDTGIVEKCQRKRKDQSTGKMVSFETYSVNDFCRWKKHGRHFDEFTLLKTLREGCQRSPDKTKEPNREVEPANQDKCVEKSQHFSILATRPARNPEETTPDVVRTKCSRINIKATHDMLKSMIPSG